MRIRKDGARAALPKLVNVLIVMYVPFSVFCVLFLCKCELYCCHRVSTQLRLNNHIFIKLSGFTYRKLGVRTHPYSTIVYVYVYFL
jgi:hypothetical protein